MKIKTFQEGSRIFAPTYNQFEFGQPSTTSQSSSRSQTKSDKDNDFIGKDLMKSLIGKGITNDVNASIQALMSIQETYQNMSDFEKSSQSGISVLNEMQQQSGKVNQLLRNADQFKQGQDQVVKNNAMNDVAISGRQIVLQDQSGKLLEMSPEEYQGLDQKEREKYRSLTNAELISQREYNSQLQGDVQSFTFLNNNASLSAINTQLKDIMATITSSKVEESYDSYTDPNGKLQEGLQILRQMSNAPIDNILYTISTESNADSAKLVLDSMWQSLGENSKTLLKSQAALAGYKQEDLEQVQQSYLIKMIAPKIQTNTSRETKVDLASKSGSKSGSSSDGISGGADDKDKITGYWDGFQNDVLPRETISLSPFGGGLQLNASASSYGPMRNKEGNSYTLTPLSQVAELETMTHRQAATFGGDMFVDETLQSGIMYNGDTLHRATLPYIIKNGQQVVDLQLLPKYEAAMKQVEAKEASGVKLSISEKQAIFKSQGITNLDATGTPTNLKEFQMTTVYLGEEIYDILDESSQAMLVQVDNPGAHALMQKTFEGKSQKGLYSEGDDIYQGIVYMPLRQGIGITGGVFNDGADLTIGSYKQRNAVYQTRTGQINQGLSMNYDMNQLSQTYKK